MTAEVIDMPVEPYDMLLWRQRAAQLQLGEMFGPLEVWPFWNPDFDAQVGKLVTQLKLRRVPFRVECDDRERIWVELPGSGGWERITRKVGELVE